MEKFLTDADTGETVDETAVDIALRVVGKKVDAFMEKYGLGAEAHNETTDIIVSACGVAFEAGCKFGGAIFQYECACDTIQRERESLEAKYLENGKG